MSTFITRTDAAGTGLRLAVKDLIDVASVPTTAGCAAVAEQAEPAASDASCLDGFRAAGVHIVGKTNLHELALGATGVNRWSGTPRNPLDPELVPGGSSSGSAVAVADGEADFALGTDTGGSVRVPSACCGTCGLKTTWGRVSLDGVWPVSPSLDTVGPMARDVEGLVAAMVLLEPGFGVATWQPSAVGRVRVEALPAIDNAVDRALAEVGWDVVAMPFPQWESVWLEAAPLLIAEAWEADAALVIENPDKVGSEIAERLRLGEAMSAEVLIGAREAIRSWQDQLQRAFGRVELLALPTLGSFPPSLNDEEDVSMVRTTVPVNVGGVPAVSLPIPSSSRLPASIQLVGRWGAEEQLLAAAASLESALRSSGWSPPFS